MTNIYNIVYVQFSENKKFSISSDNGVVDTPVPIPNTMVKRYSADGTAGAALWESRTLLGCQVLYLAYYFGSLAQSVEHMTFNHGVRGSIPR